MPAGEPENNQVGCQPDHCPHLWHCNMEHNVNLWKCGRMIREKGWIWKRHEQGAVNLQQGGGVGEAKSSDKGAAHRWSNEIAQGKGCNMAFWQKKNWQQQKSEVGFLSGRSVLVFNRFYNQMVLIKWSQTEKDANDTDLLSTDRRWLNALHLQLFWKPPWNAKVFYFARS